jgi:hypothetical protein
MSKQLFATAAAAALFLPGCDRPDNTSPDSGKSSLGTAVAPQTRRGPHEVKGTHRAITTQRYLPPPMYKGKTAQGWGGLFLDRDFGTSQEAGIALQALGEEGTPYLVDGLCKGNRNTRVIALEHLLNQDTAIRRYAGQAVPALMEMAKEGNKAQVARLLGRIGPGAKAAAPTLQTLASDSDPEVQEAAGDALRKVAPQQ